MLLCGPSNITLYFASLLAAGHEMVGSTCGTVSGRSFCYSMHHWSSHVPHCSTAQRPLVYQERKRHM